MYHLIVFIELYKIFKQLDDSFSIFKINKEKNFELMENKKIYSTKMTLKNHNFLK